MDEELIKFFEALLSGGELRKEALKLIKVDDYEVDTCDTADCGWETAIRKAKRNWIVVQRYANKELAEKGHKIWGAFCAAKPIKVYDIQYRTEREF